VPIRRLAAVVAAVALTLCWPSPASAHRDITLTLHTDGRGSIWVTAAWADGHPVTDPIGAMLVATSANGERLGPVKLRNIERSTGTLVYENTLSAGEWTVVAETGEDRAGPAGGALRTGRGVRERHIARPVGHHHARGRRCRRGRRGIGHLLSDAVPAAARAPPASLVGPVRGALVEEGCHSLVRRRGL
jgi:hypothetical protein